MTHSSFDNKKNKEEAIIKIKNIFYSKVLETFGLRALVGVTF